jgi:hypothetical protein
MCTRPRVRFMVLFRVGIPEPVWTGRWECVTSVFIVGQFSVKVEFFYLTFTIGFLHSLPKHSCVLAARVCWDMSRIMISWLSTTGGSRWWGRFSWGERCHLQKLSIILKYVLHLKNTFFGGGPVGNLWWVRVQFHPWVQLTWPARKPVPSMWVSVFAE